MANEYKLFYTATEIDERLGMVDSMVKSVNGVVPDESGNVVIEVGSDSGQNATADLGYKWSARGYMRKQVREFQGWANNIVFDKSLNVAVGYVSSANASHSSIAPMHRVEIDPKTGYMGDYDEFTINVPEGEEDVTFVAVTILQDGTYLWCDWYGRLFVSSDHGRVFDYVATVSPGGRTTYNNDTLYGLKQISNGRILAGNCGNTAAETYFSDDKGLNWTTVTMDRSGLGQQVYPEGNYTPFEPCFIEIGDGKVIQYARASMNAYKTYAEGAYTAQEAAVYSISEDYGATWTPWAWSTAITDMTANNGKAVVIGDKVHFVYGSRYGAEDNDFHLFYTTTTLTDILSDKWDAPIVIDVGHWDKETATNPHDCGYPSLFADENSNLFAVYYDGDGTGTAFGANWRLCIGTQAAAQIAPVTNEGGGSTTVGYTQSAVDKLIAGLLAKINDLYLKIGELPEQDKFDGTYPVTDGLIEWFEPGDETQWTDTVLSSKMNSGHTANGLRPGGIKYCGTQAPITFAGNMADVGVGFDGTLASYGITNECTMELVIDMANNQVNTLLSASAPSSYGTPNALYTRNNNFNNVYVGTAYHWVVVFTLESTSVYYNGTLVEQTTALTEDDFAAAYPVCLPYSGGVGGVRLYNRALTDEEIQNNYKYASTLTTFGTSYF